MIAMKASTSPGLKESPSMIALLMKPLRHVIAGVMFLALASPVMASYASYNETMTISSSTTDFSQALAFKSFNASLGTLVSVQISYSDSAVISGFVQNTSASAQNFSVTEKSAVTLTYGTTAMLTNNLLAAQSYTNLGGNGASSNFGTYNPTGQATSTPISSGPVFKAFDGASNVTLDFGTLTSTTVTGGGGNINTGIYTSVGATVMVDFVYTPFTVVPEPASLAMTSIGGVMLAIWQYRKRRTR
jgi:hypothetical protein